MNLRLVFYELTNPCDEILGGCAGNAVSVFEAVNQNRVHRFV
jgi:hypothetical protein